MAEFVMSNPSILKNWEEATKERKRRSNIELLFKDDNKIKQNKKKLQHLNLYMECDVIPTDFCMRNII